jgi:hypothetical protein
MVMRTTSRSLGGRLVAWTEPASGGLTLGAAEPDDGEAPVAPSPREHARSTSRHGTSGRRTTARLARAGAPYAFAVLAPFYWRKTRAKPVT